MKMSGFQILDLCIAIVLLLVMVGLFVVAAFSKVAVAAVVSVLCALGLGAFSGFFFYNALSK